MTRMGKGSGLGMIRIIRAEWRTVGVVRWRCDDTRCQLSSAQPQVSFPPRVYSGSSLTDYGARVIQVRPGIRPGWGKVGTPVVDNMLLVSEKPKESVHQSG